MTYFHPLLGQTAGASGLQSQISPKSSFPYTTLRSSFHGEPDPPGDPLTLLNKRTSESWEDGIDSQDFASPPSAHSL